MKYGCLESHKRRKIWSWYAVIVDIFWIRFHFVVDILSIYRSPELTWNCRSSLAVVYNFDGNVTHGLRLTIGETVHILEECSGLFAN